MSSGDSIAAEMGGDGNGLSHGRLEQHKFFFLKTF
jgi:hypothetical protein